VTLDATPEASRAGQPAPWLDWLTRQYEALDGLWRSGVVDYSFQDQMQLARSLVKPPRSSQEREREWLPPRRVMLSLGTALALGYALFRLRRFRPRTARTRAVGDATALLDAAERLLRQAGLKRPPGGATRDGVEGVEGVEELSARLAREGHPLSAPLSQLTRRYLEARFGSRPLAPGERAALLAHVRQALDREAAEARARRKSA
jgi:hypothetical protein